MSGAPITVFTKLPADNDFSGSLLSKRIALVDDCVVSDGSPCRMAFGYAEVVGAATASDLAEVIAGLSSHNALALGRIAVQPRARVVTVHALRKLEAHTSSEGLPIIARTRDFIDYQGGPSWMLFDSDKKGMPSEVSAAIADRGGVWRALLSIIPGLAQAARVTRASTSAGLRRADTGETILGSGGEHHYVLVADGTDIDRALTTMHDLLPQRQPNPSPLSPLCPASRPTEQTAGRGMRDMGEMIPIARRPTGVKTPTISPISRRAER